ncbi:putative ABC transporter permease [Konateibacter massiliensis]|uniref:putative ABC transporter permease n=1 Tax=Konateibacter massiliensis TaxID=2002841 RepID=UPI000C15FDE5|nr:hypothetical protein [Konateibacter massiliensis]
MFSYRILEWILFFYIYCVFGWVFESTYVSLKSKKPVNRGFLKGPMIPIYGEGAIMMLIATYPVRGHIVLEFVMGMVGATLLEYVVGALMETVFKVKYWDYSNQRFHIKGYICLSSTICWGFLSVLMAEVIHLPIERAVLSMNETVLFVAVFVITVIFMIDAATSAKDAWDLRIVLIALTKAKEEIASLQHQIKEKKDAIAEQLSDTKEYIAEQLSDTKEHIAGQLSDTKVHIAEQLADKKGELAEDIHATKEYVMQSIKGNISLPEMDKLKGKLEEELGRYQSLVEKVSFSSGRLLRRNPGATSKRFYEALENVKEAVESKRKKK